MSKFHLLSLALLVAGLGACERRPSSGSLRVEAPGSGSYEVYRIAAESPLQFVSDESGNFNEDMTLAAGSYLVLADCSSATVIIYPGQRETLMVHRIEFVPPHVPTESDSFSIQCSRSERTRSRQHITNRFQLNILAGQHDILVGMVPFHLEPPTGDAAKTPQTTTYKLSALQVAAIDGFKGDLSYFVSPVDELVAATNSQVFGHWDFLLPGRYALEVNGTRLEVMLAEGEERIVKPGFLTISTSGEIDLRMPMRVTGNPQLVEINSGHWLNFNETYPVLPGVAQVQISGSNQAVDVEIKEGETQELEAQSIEVDLGCAENDWGCLGGKDISLYLDDQPYPFAESVSDVPILYVKQTQPVWVGVGGSRDIRYQVASTKRDHVLKLGFAEIVPQPTYKPGQVTDLVRVEALGLPLSGETLDINLETKAKMPLIEGRYSLSHYVTNTSSEGDRRKQPHEFFVKAGETVTLDIPVYFNEKKFAAYRKRHEGDAPSAAENAPAGVL
jgi:hypothetical protein